MTSWPRHPEPSQSPEPTSSSTGPPPSRPATPRRTPALKDSATFTTGTSSTTSRKHGGQCKGADLGGPQKVATDPQGNVQPQTWDYGSYVAAGTTQLVPVPGQVKSSPLGGSGNGKNRIDASQGFGQLGGYGSGDAHVQRRAGIDPVPGNWQWLNSSERPIMVPRRGYQASFDGPDSPYGALGDTSQDMQLGTSRTTVASSPTPYNDPPQPYTAPVTAAAGPMISDWF